MICPHQCKVWLFCNRALLRVFCANFLLQDAQSDVLDDDRSFKFKHHRIIIECHLIFAAHFSRFTFSCSSQNKQRKEPECVHLNSSESLNRSLFTSHSAACALTCSIFNFLSAVCSYFYSLMVFSISKSGSIPQALY